MIRLVVFFVGILAAAAGLHWLADRPGALTLSWQDYVIETSAFRAVLLLAALVVSAVVAWSIARHVWRSPASIGQLVTRRRERRGLDAISSGMIAIGSGDKALAMRAAVQARKSLPNEPLTHLLRAQAAQLQGDAATARRIFEAMLASPDTEQVGLRGLYLEAERVGEGEAATQFAARALKLNPKIEWPAGALFDLQCKARDWSGALDTLAVAKRNGHIDKKVADRRRAVLLTAQAQAAEAEHPDHALELANEAHGLAPDLIPAGAIAGRVLAARGQTPKAAKVIQRTWKLAPHPELALAYAYARPGDSPSDRLARIRQLAATNPLSVEGPIAVATIAVESRDWEAARAALLPLVETGMSQRVATLMAQIEGEGFNNTGRVREWLARSVHAERDPAWTADGVVADQWSPVSPVTGALDAFAWRVPVSNFDQPGAALIAERMDALVRLGTNPGLPPPAQPQREASVVEIVVDKANAPKSPQPKRTAEDWLHDDDDQPPRRGNGTVPKTAVTAVAAKPSVPKPLAGTVAVSRATPKTGEPIAAGLPRAPDDPGLEPLDSATAKSQLERYRLIGAKT